MCIAIEVGEPLPFVIMPNLARLEKIKFKF